MSRSSVLRTATLALLVAAGCAAHGPQATSPDPETAQAVLMANAEMQQQIDAVVNHYLNMFRYCYQKELVRVPDLAGDLVVRFEIAPDGTVSSATVASSTLGNEAVEDCVVGRFMRFQFPAPPGGGSVVVSYPFRFAPGPIE